LGVYMTWFTCKAFGVFLIPWKRTHFEMMTAARSIYLVWGMLEVGKWACLARMWEAVGCIQICTASLFLKTIL